MEELKTREGKEEATIKKILDLLLVRHDVFDAVEDGEGCLSIFRDADCYVTTCLLEEIADELLEILRNMPTDSDADAIFTELSKAGLLWSLSYKGKTKIINIFTMVEEDGALKW